MAREEHHQREAGGEDDGLDRLVDPERRDHATHAVTLAPRVRRARPAQQDRRSDPDLDEAEDAHGWDHPAIGRGPRREANTHREGGEPGG